MLGIHQFGFFGVDAKEGRVEFIHVRQGAAGADEATPRLMSSGLAHVYSRVAGSNFSTPSMPSMQHPPEFIRAGRPGKASGHADDGDGFWRLLNRFRSWMRCPAQVGKSCLLAAGAVKYGPLACRAGRNSARWFARARTVVWANRSVMGNGRPVHSQRRVCSTASWSELPPRSKKVGCGIVHGPGQHLGPEGEQASLPCPDPTGRAVVGASADRGRTLLQGQTVHLGVGGHGIRIQPLQLLRRHVGGQARRQIRSHIGKVGPRLRNRAAATR
jgi:hypothetical protein